MKGNGEEGERKRETGSNLSGSHAVVCGVDSPYVLLTAGMYCS
jgi:hypothetical protein